MLEENEIGKLIIDAAISVHKELGPGLLESVYEIILAHELVKSGLSVKRQVSVPIECYGLKFDEGFRSDIIVEK
jgi:GxxExxY protein